MARTASEAKVNHKCPTYCHPCPYLKGDVLPMCYGTAISAEDGIDLRACTCDPAHPAIDRGRLGELAFHYINLLRDQRRFRTVQRNTVRELLRRVELMRTASADQLRQGWPEIASLIRRLATEYRDPLTVEHLEREQSRVRVLVGSFGAKAQNE